MLCCIYPCPLYTPYPHLSLLYFIWLPTYIKYLLGKCLELHMMYKDQLVTMGASFSSYILPLTSPLIPSPKRMTLGKGILLILIVKHSQSFPLQ